MDEVSMMDGQTLDHPTNLHQSRRTDGRPVLFHVPYKQILQDQILLCITGSALNKDPYEPWNSPATPDPS